jgi:hypothetical protein
MAALTPAIIDEKHYVARYARGGLSDAEREAFEEYCLLHPEVAEQVATDRALLRGMRGLPPSRASHPLRRWMSYPLAAGIVVAAIALGTLAYRHSTSSITSALYAYGNAIPGNVGKRIAAPQRVVLERGKPVELEGHGELNALRLEVILDPSITGTEFRVELVEYTPQGELRHGFVSQRPQMVDGERVLPLVVDLAVVRSNRLRLDVQSDGAEQSFELRVAR